MMKKNTTNNISDTTTNDQNCPSGVKLVSRQNRTPLEAGSIIIQHLRKIQENDRSHEERGKNNHNVSKYLSKNGANSNVEKN